MNALILRSLGTLIVTLSLISTIAHGGDFGNNNSEKDEEVVELQEFLRNGVIHKTDTNNVHIFEKYLTEKFSPNNYYDAIIKLRISTKGIDLTIENINEEKKVIYDTLQLMTKEEIEHLLHEVLEKRIRKEASDALYALDKKLKVANVIEVYSEVKKLSIKDIRECIKNVRYTDVRGVFHINLLNNYYYSDEKQPST